MQGGRLIEGVLIGVVAGLVLNAMQSPKVLRLAPGVVPQSAKSGPVRVVMQDAKVKPVAKA